MQIFISHSECVHAIILNRSFCYYESRFKPKLVQFIEFLANASQFTNDGGASSEFEGTQSFLILQLHWIFETVIKL